MRRVNAARAALTAGLGLSLLVAAPAPGWADSHAESEAVAEVEAEADGDAATTAGTEADEGLLDRVNRKTRSFNFWLFDTFVDPLGRGYNFVMPKWGQARVKGVLENLHRPRDVVNSLLQGKLARAGNHTASFGINTTVGVLGMFDLAEGWIGAEPPETTAETLGVWGLPSGNLVAIPFVGDSCLRCLVGSIGDSALHPLFWFPGGNVGIAARVGATTLERVNLLARQMPTPFADEAAWKAYERLIHSRPPYPEAKRLFYENLALDVAD